MLNYDPNQETQGDDGFIWKRGRALFVTLGLVILTILSQVAPALAGGYVNFK